MNKGREARRQSRGKDRERFRLTGESLGKAAGCQIISEQIIDARQVGVQMLSQ